MFYVAGYGFERTEIGGVKIQPPEGNEVVLTIDDWCSMLASVSLMGDTGEGFDAAFEFHTKSPSK